MSAKKIVLIVAVVLVLVGIVVGTILHGQAGVTKVATGKVERQDLISIVNGTGQIKPKTYVNIGATAFGRITHLYVKEGDHVKAGATLATVESVQPQATVEAQQATIAAANTDITSFLAAEKTAEANIAQGKADLEQKQLDYNRPQALFNDKLIAKQDYDAKKAAYDMAVATLAQRQAALAQSRAQTESQRGHMNQAVASQRANFDALDKTVSRAPFDGLVTNVPVREGETVVLGIQNAEGSPLMTLADMSVITAEVKVDETDIVNVRMNQPAEITIDAIPKKIFHGTVSEIGDNAIVRSSGVSTSQQSSASEEAKDFKVVVTVTDPPQDLRPGLSTTAKITTAARSSGLSIPIQALSLRSKAQLEQEKSAPGSVHAAGPTPKETSKKDQQQDLQGVFVIRNKKAVFVPISTGITGTSDIEVLNGLQDGDEVITGSYKILRTLRSGSSVKIDNSVPKKEEESS